MQLISSAGFIEIAEFLIKIFNFPANETSWGCTEDFPCNQTIRSAPALSMQNMKGKFLHGKWLEMKANYSLVDFAVNFCSERKFLRLFEWKGLGQSLVEYAGTLKCFLEAWKIENLRINYF